MNTHSHAREYAAETRVLRYMSDSLALPALCRTATCRRTGHCKGEPRECLRRLAPLVPEDAREWMKAALEGLKEDRDFFEVRAEYADEFEAFVAWRETLAHAHPR